MPVLSMVIMVAVLLLLQKLIYHKRWDKKLSLKLAFSAKEAFEGDTLTLVQELTNAKWLPLPWVGVKFQLSQNLHFLHYHNEYYKNDVFSIGMYQRITRRLDFECGRRGYYRINNVSLSASDIFLADLLVRQTGCTADLTVFPRLIPFGDLELFYRQIQGDILIHRFTNLDPFAFRGIREYEPQDDFRSINFKATAKTGELMVNINSATASQEMVILLNLQEYSAWSSQDVFEEGIRLAASIAEHFAGQGLSVGLISNGRDIVSGDPLRILPGSGDSHIYGILRKLARIDLSKDPGSFSDLLRDIYQPEPSYILISSYDKCDLLDSFDRMLENGLSVRWILPALSDMELNTENHPNILRWEVNRRDYQKSFIQESAG